MPPRKATPENLMTVADLVGDEAPDFNGADPAKFDHDGDGRPGGSLPRVMTTAPQASGAQIGEVVKAGAPPSAVAGDADVCRVRITKAGHGKVHTGKARPKTYDWNAEVILPRDVGEALEAKAYAEVLD